MKTRTISFLLTLCCVLGATAASPDAQKLPGRLVSTEWLRTNLRAGGLRIIDIRSDVRAYWAGHIPGAVYFHPEAMRLADHGLPVMLAPLDILIPLFEAMGIERRTRVVVYSDPGDFRTAYLIWALDYLGHADSAILEGGFARWTSENSPVTQDYPSIRPARYDHRRASHEVRADRRRVLQAVRTGNAVILDVRPRELYTGEQGDWKRRGHIRGAVHRFWGDDLGAGGLWRDGTSLRQAYQALGVTPDRPVIVSCGQGQMSAHTYFTLKYILGFPDVRNYDGGFNEWSAIGELPVETGEK